MAKKEINFEDMKVTLGYFSLVGLEPCLMHNGRLADPEDHYAKEIKKITDKQRRTEKDAAAIADLEMAGGLYLDRHEKPCWPGRNLKGMTIEAGKTWRKGKEMKKAILSPWNWPLKHSGPNDADKIVDDPKMRHREMVKVSGKVPRFRPKFHDWSIEFVFMIQEVLTNFETVMHCVKVAGVGVGLGDGRPEFGKFMLDKDPIKLEVPLELMEKVQTATPQGVIDMCKKGVVE